MIAALLIALALVPAPDLQARLPTPASVVCAETDSDWQQLIGYYSLRQGTIGLTDTQTWTIYLEPELCERLRNPQDDTLQAAMYFAFYHEYVHARDHTADEAYTDCTSLHNLRYWLRTEYAMPKIDAEVTYANAWQYHKAKPAEYQGTCTYERVDQVSIDAGLDPPPPVSEPTPPVSRDWTWFFWRAHLPHGV